MDSDNGTRIWFLSLQLLAILCQCGFHSQKESVCVVASWPLQCQYFIFPGSELAWQRAVFGAWFVDVLLAVGKGK